jgi:hypothetical protein
MRASLLRCRYCTRSMRPACVANAEARTAVQNCPLVTPRTRKGKISAYPPASLPTGRTSDQSSVKIPGENFTDAFASDKHDTVRKQMPRPCN